jgi:hypothetical protein
MYYRRFRDFFDASDDITRIIAFAALIMLLVITLPTLAPRIPAVRNGAVCSSLYSPPGDGTQQSILGRAAGTGALKLELTVGSNFLGSGDALILQVHFVNQSAGPLLLALVPEEAVFRYTDAESGLMFAVQTTDGRALGEPTTTRPPAPIRTQFSQDQLHVLNPRERCTQTITITPDRLAAAGLGQGGQYQVMAVYRNLAPGKLLPIGQLTPTPIFPDQAVWVSPPGGVHSNIVTFGFGVTPVPLQ